MAELMAWGRKHVLASYDRVGLRNQRWDPDARRFIADALPSLVGGVSTVTNEVLVTRGRALVHLGCRDPLVLYLLGRHSFQASWDAPEPEYYFAQAVEGFKTVPYPRALARFAASALYGRYEWRTEGIGLRSALGQLELKWFEESMVDGSFEPGDSSVLVDQIVFGTGWDFFGRSGQGAAVVVAKAQWLEPWARLCLLGILHYDQAWDARGYGWAKDVKPDSWRRFETLNAQARQELVAAWRLRPDRPEPALAMIAVARDDPDPGDSPRVWFDRTVANQLDVLGAYKNMLDSLLPRWGGSYPQMLAFAREALDTRRFDTDVPLQYFEAVMQIYDDQRSDGGAGGTPVFDRPDTYPTLVRLFESYLKEPRRPGNDAYYQSLWAIAADRAHRPQDALAHLDAAGGQLPPSVSSYLGDESPETFVARVTLNASPIAEAVRRGDGLRLRFENEAAIDAYVAAIEKEPSSRAATVLRERVASLETEQALARGEWVPMLPTSDELKGWHTLLGKWSVEKDGALVGTASARGLLLVSESRVGPDFEMEGDAAMVSSLNGHFQARFAFGHPSWKKKGWYSFGVKRNTARGSRAFFARYLYDTEPAPTIPILDVNHMRVRVQDGRMTAFVNGRLVPQDFAPGEDWKKDDRSVVVGLGGYSEEPLWAVRLRHVRVRRLGKGD